MPGTDVGATRQPRFFVLYQLQTRFLTLKNRFLEVLMILWVFLSVVLAPCSSSPLAFAPCTPPLLELVPYMICNCTCKYLNLFLQFCVNFVRLDPKYRYCPLNAVILPCICVFMNAFVVCSVCLRLFVCSPDLFARSQKYTSPPPSFFFDLGSGSGSVV